MRVKKGETLRIRGNELFTYISANTSLTNQQVENVLKHISNKMIKEISSSKHADKGLTIILPYRVNSTARKKKRQKRW